MSKNVTRVPPPQEEQRELLRVRTSQQIQWHHSHECKRCQMFAQSRVMGNGLSLSSMYTELEIHTSPGDTWGHLPTFWIPWW